MSISYGIKPDWPVTLRTSKKVKALAYHLQKQEKVINLVADPQEFFQMNETDTRRVSRGCSQEEEEDRIYWLGGGGRTPNRLPGNVFSRIVQDAQACARVRAWLGASP